MTNEFSTLDPITLDLVTGGYDFGAAVDNANLWGARGLQAGSYLGAAVGAVAGTTGGAVGGAGVGAAPGWYGGTLAGGLIGGAAGGAIGWLGGLGASTYQQLRGK
jgi:hypothetical protein